MIELLQKVSMLQHLLVMVIQERIEPMIYLCFVHVNSQNPTGIKSLW